MEAGKKRSPSIRWGAGRGWGFFDLRDEIHPATTCDNDRPANRFPTGRTNLRSLAGARCHPGGGNSFAVSAAIVMTSSQPGHWKVVSCGSPPSLGITDATVMAWPQDGQLCVFLGSSCSGMATN